MVLKFKVIHPLIKPIPLAGAVSNPSDLTVTQLHLIDMRKRLMAWSCLSVLLLCLFTTLDQVIPFAGWPKTLMALEMSSVVVLFLQISLIVLISCCNLTKSRRY